MKIHINISFILTMLLSLISCTNELPFDIKENPPKLIMNALMSTESTSNELYLHLTGKDNVTPLREATVEVYVNGTLTERLRPLSQESYSECRFVIQSPFAPGDMVRIEAFTDDGRYHAWAETTVPQRPMPIERIDTLTIPITRYGYSKDYLRYKITLQDRTDEANYYRIVLDKQTTLWGFNHEEGESEYRYWTQHDYYFLGNEDIVLTDGQPYTLEDEDNNIFDTIENIYGVFDDSRFKDSSYTMTVYNDAHIIGGNTGGFLDKVDVIVRLKSLTSTEYYYLKALNYLDSYAYDETINEPVRLPSNVHGGTGIISISTEVDATISIIASQRPQEKDSRQP